jgi:hypothetical protein
VGIGKIGDEGVRSQSLGGVISKVDLKYDIVTVGVLRLETLARCYTWWLTVIAGDVGLHTRVSVGHFFSLLLLGKQSDVG